MTDYILETSRNKLEKNFSYLSDLKNFSLEFQKIFSITRKNFLTEGQNNFGNKIPGREIFIAYNFEKINYNFGIFFQVIDETPDEPMEVSGTSEPPATPETETPPAKKRGRPKKEAVAKIEVKPEEVEGIELAEVKEEVKKEVNDEVEDVVEMLKPKTRNQSGSR